MCAGGRPGNRRVKNWGLKPRIESHDLRFTLLPFQLTVYGNAGVAHATPAILPHRPYRARRRTLFTGIELPGRLHPRYD